MTEAEKSPVVDYGWESGEAEASHDYLQPVVMNVLTHLAPRSGAASPLRIFDAGCGNGALLKRLMEFGYTVAGCDASPSGVREARALCGSDARIELIRVDGNLSATFGDDWDVVVSTEVIEHLYAPRDFVREARQLLKPGGTLLLSTPYHGYLKNLALAIAGGFDRHFTALWDGGHIKFWSYHTLRTLLREFGFGEFRFYGAGRLPWLWKSMVITARKLD